MLLKCNRSAKTSQDNKNFPKCLEKIIYIFVAQWNDKKKEDLILNIKNKKLNNKKNMNNCL